jgi:hypothetical protein
MAIGFTEFLKYESKDVGLYTIQVNNVLEELCFRIYLRLEDVTVLISCKLVSGIWKILPQDIPTWVNELKPEFTLSIEIRMSVK